MSAESFPDALHKITLGLGDLKELRVELANAINVRCERIKATRKLENPSKDEVRTLARIDQLRSALRDRCKAASLLPGVTQEQRLSLQSVSDTLSCMKEIDLTTGAP